VAAAVIAERSIFDLHIEVLAARVGSQTRRLVGLGSKSSGLGLCPCWRRPAELIAT